MTASTPNTGARELPQWRECPPPTPGLYITFSADPKRHDEPGIAEWDGKVWQMHLGWYDHAITHWMPTDLNQPKAPRHER